LAANRPQKITGKLVIVSAIRSKDNVARTRTGGIPIGFRRSGSEWQKDLKTLLAWAEENHFSVIDLGSDGDKTAAVATAKGFRIGSVDLLHWWGKMISPDKATRDEAVAANSAYIEACAASGPINHLVAMIPEKPELNRAENFGYMVESYGRLAPVLEAHDARIVIEGWPGPGALCCTPETCEAFFRECPSKAFGMNYDPSHLLRMGIDHLRFLREFIGRVYHLHGKDTELLDDQLYRYGNLQEPTFGARRVCGDMHWRYAIPGHGSVRWVEIFKILAEAKYRGAISIELEDENFCNSPEAEKAGLLHARDFLESC
jgi:sugar phosphate isomerase/epimerase